MRNHKTMISYLMFFFCISTGYAADINFDVIVAGEIKPGVYGRVQLGNAPPPEVINVQPVVIGKHTHVKEPVYMHVPPGHAKHWDKHCHKYDACNRPVYFVKSAEYEPEHQSDKKHKHKHKDKHGH